MSTLNENINAALSSVNASLININDLSITAKDCFKMATIMAHMRKASEILEALQKEVIVAEKSDQLTISNAK